MNLMKQNNLNFYGPINPLGYGISSYNIWKNLRQNISTTLFPINEVQLENHWLKTELVEDIKNQLNYDVTAPCLKVWHAHDMLIKPHNKNLYAGYTFFEIDKITNQERIGYEILDVIFVPSQWAKNVLISNDIDAQKIIVAPAGVDTEIFDHHKYEDVLEDKTDKYIFLNIGKWEARKGHDILLHIFNKAFLTNDNVELWMMNTNPFLSQKDNNQWINMYKNTNLGSKIKILPRMPTQKDVAKIIKMSDCGIYPSRAEGWNNEAIETMAMNKPIIITDYSAHTEYCDKKNSYLLDIKNTEIAEDGLFFNGHGNWADIDDCIDQCVEYMREVYKNNIRTNITGVETAQQFNWKKTCNIIQNNLYE